VRVDVPGTFTLAVLSVAVTLGDPFSVKPTFAVKPRTLVRLTVDAQEEPPATTAMKKGSVEISKSGCLT